MVTTPSLLVIKRWKVIGVVELPNGLYRVMPKNKDGGVVFRDKGFLKFGGTRSMSNSKSNSEKKYEAEVNVVSKNGPIRIELFDHNFKRRAIGFGELHQRVQEGLYTLRYTAGTAQREERISVDPGETLSTTWVDLPFQSSAPIRGSSTTHEFHHYPASNLSRQPNKKLGTDGCMMIFVRTIDGNGRAPVSLDSLSLLDSQLRRILNLNDRPAQNPAEGWAGQCIQLNPGGYALQWKAAESESKRVKRMERYQSINLYGWPKVG